MRRFTTLWALLLCGLATMSLPAVAVAIDRADWDQRVCPVGHSHGARLA